MLRLREMGFERYDWGGLFADESRPERAGINNFKRDFGGRQIRVYDCTVAVNLKGRLYLPLRDAWRRTQFWARPAAAAER
jgi:lipid II:glycine glycyltransferase (peptidoglycan interpeptide bridge formation enzyme)